MADQSEQPLRYRGWHNTYIDIAVRNTDEHLGLSIDYVSGGGASGVVLRFVAHGKGVGPTEYKHLMYREPAKFLIPATDTKSAEMFTGIRLNKVALKVFEPAVAKWELDKYATQFAVWPLLIEWIAEQVMAEGFTVTVQLLPVVRELLDLVEAENVKCVLAFHDLTSPEQQASALKQVKAPEPEETEEDDEEDDDKPWIN